MASVVVEQVVTESELGIGVFRGCLTGLGGVFQAAPVAGFLKPFHRESATSHNYEIVSASCWAQLMLFSIERRLTRAAN